MPKLKPLAEQVIVITGASSGIGLATAQAAAARGATVVLAARTRDALSQAVDEINQNAGAGRASFVEADVGNHDEVEKIAAYAIERHGRIDTWINNAGVMVFGKLEEVSEADMRSLFESNFWSVVHGSLIAVRHLKDAGGALINVGSVEGDRGVPLQGIYTASKHAIKGFTEVLRAEVRQEKWPISVTLIKPGAIGTPLPQHTKSYEGREPQLPPPLYSPEEAAATILRAAERPTRTAYVGGAGRAIGIVAAVAPRLVDWVSANFLVPAQISDRPSGDSNLEQGRSEAKVRGDHSGAIIRPSLYGAATRNPVTTLAVAGGVVAGAFLLRRRNGGDEHMPAMDDVTDPLPVEGV